MKNLTLEQYERLIDDLDRLRQFVSTDDEAGFDIFLTELINRIGDWVTFPVAVWILDDPPEPIENEITDTEKKDYGNRVLKLARLGEAPKRKINVRKLDLKNSKHRSIDKILEYVKVKETPKEEGRSLIEAYKKAGHIPTDPSQSLVGKAIDQRKTQINNHLQPQLPTTLFYQKEIAIEFKWMSVMVVPIIDNDEVFGSISLYAKTPNWFSFKDRQLVEKLAKLAGAVMQQRIRIKRIKQLETLIENIQEQVDRIEEIHNYSLEISQKKTLDEKLDAVVETATKLLHGSGGVLYRKVPNKDRIKISAVCGILGDIPLTFEMDYGVGLAGRLMKESMDHLIENDFPNSDTLAKYKEELSVFKDRFNAVIEVPIKVFDEKIGILAIVSDEKNRHFDSSEVTPLRLLSHVASLAIEPLTKKEQDLWYKDTDLEQKISQGKEVESDILIAFGDELKGILSADQIDIHLINENAQPTIIQIPKHDKYPESRYLSDYPSLLREAVDENKIIHIPDAANDERVNERIVEEFGYKAILGLPLVHYTHEKTHKLGAVFVNIKNERKVTREEIATLRLVAKGVSNSIFQVRTRINLEKEQLKKELNRQGFLRNIAHNIRKPVLPMVNLVDSISHILENNYVDSKEIISKLTAELFTNLQFMESMLRNFEEEYEHGEIKLDYKEAHAFPIIIRLITSLEAYARISRGIGIKVNNPPTQQSLLWMDAERVKLAIFNILINAINYSEPDAEDIEIKLQQTGTSKTGLTTYIDIHNWGPGIEEKEKLKIFERGFTGSTTGELVVKSTGIGLSVAKKIIDLHDGKIEVKKLKNPTIFRIVLPKTEQN